ncbi:ABC transporter permease [Planctobacterium marinum]|uniref:ABC transporter permease n=1 Tax=Planctobacterium marinum TaxID=1631968 RepID=UPI001E44FB9F|nr:ABC transporter permease [Planctobacterium marinum]MCC2605218.1 ABC transporter permease [Planctobacterium marinum]
MFKNYLQIAWRNLIADRLYSSINILGLAVGLASCLLLFIFIEDETSFDEHWPAAERTYLVQTTYFTTGAEAQTFDVAPGPLKQVLLDYFPDQLESATRMNRQWPIVKTRNDIYEEPLYFADPNTIDILQFDTLAGDLQSTINDNAAIALSEQLAIKYFGNTDAIGEIITIESWGIVKDFRVGAVYANVAHNTNIEGLTALIKIVEEDYLETQPWLFTNWGGGNNMTLITLKPGANIGDINERMEQLVKDKVIVPEFVQETYAQPEDWIAFEAIPLDEMYINQPGRKTNIAIFSGIALVILLIASINFTNLSVARSTRRAKEVALRKVMGASRQQLILQFLGETIFITVIALVLALMLVELALPFYSEFLERDLVFDYLGVNTLAMIGLVLTVGILGGVYPALVLSAFRPARVLKANKSAETSGSLMLRNLLVIAQFSISIALIVCAMVMFAQRQHAMNLEVGYDKDHIVILHGVGREPVAQQSRQKLLREQVLDLPGMKAATYINMFPAMATNWQLGLSFNREDGSQFSETISFRNVDEGFLDTFNAKVITGRYFDLNISSDVRPDFQLLHQNPETRQINTMVNEQAVAHFGFASNEDILGQVLEYRWGDMTIFATVIGVISDINYRTVRESIRPEVYIFVDYGGIGFLAVRFEDAPQRAEQTLLRYWQEQVPELPFVRTYVSEVIERDFQSEQKQALLLAIASSLAVIVSCLGLFGLASFTAERRFKEIGIRKVMGASVLDIVKLLTWQFSKPVLLASFIGCAGAAMLMLSWLQIFPYRISELWVLGSCLTASLLALLIAWLTVGGKATKVAQATPIKALRYE